MGISINNLKLVKNITPNYEAIRKIIPGCFRKIGEKCVAGPVTAMESSQNLKKLYESGIRTIVDFRAEATDSFQHACETQKLKYFSFPLDLIRNFSNSKIFVKAADGSKVQVTDKFIKDLQKFFNMINNENIYMGCHYGVHRTNTGVLLNYILNPKATEAPIIKGMDGEQINNLINSTLRAIQKIIHKLTPEQRKALNLADDFMSNEYLKKVGKLKEINRIYYSC